MKHINECGGWFVFEESVQGLAISECPSEQTVLAISLACKPASGDMQWFDINVRKQLLKKREKKSRVMLEALALVQNAAGSSSV